MQWLKFSSYSVSQPPNCSVVVVHLHESVATKYAAISAHSSISADIHLHGHCCRAATKLFTKPHCRKLIIILVLAA
jgi:hypothetical protein